MVRTGVKNNFLFLARFRFSLRHTDFPPTRFEELNLSIPSTVGQLTGLRRLLLNNNPLVSLTKQIVAL